jgi:uncharacterized protein
MPLLDKMVDFNYQSSKPRLDLVVIKLSSLCNIKCSYCYIYETGYINSLAHQPKLITEETIINLSRELTRLKDFCENPEFQIVFHGGEPLLVGNQRLEFILNYFKNFENKSVQTNGTILNKKTLDLLYKNKCSIGLSLDGNAELNDKNRVDKRGQGTFSRVMKGLDLILAHPISECGFSMIIAVIDPTSDPIETYDYLRQFNPNAVDFLFKDGYHDQLPTGKKDLNSTEYGEWLTKLARYYFLLPNPIPIRKIDTLVDDYIATKVGTKLASPFGMFVINPDGTTTKNELYDIIPMSSRFSRTWNVNQDSLLELLSTDEYRNYTFDTFPKSNICHKCEHLAYCGGGSEIHARYKNNSKLENPSIFCSDYKYFYNEMGTYIDQHLSYFKEHTTGVSEKMVVL